MIRIARPTFYRNDLVFNSGEAGSPQDPPGRHNPGCQLRGQGFCILTGVGDRQLEARGGIEPPKEALQASALTTWLPRPLPDASPPCHRVGGAADHRPPLAPIGRPPPLSLR